MQRIDEVCLENLDTNFETKMYELFEVLLFDKKLAQIFYVVVNSSNSTLIGRSKL